MSSGRAYLHLASPWYRPSWQGGDGAQPLCMKPSWGLFTPPAGQFFALTDTAGWVTCPTCRRVMDGGPRRLAPQRGFGEAQAPKPLGCLAVPASDAEDRPHA